MKKTTNLDFALFLTLSCCMHSHHLDFDWQIRNLATNQLKSSINYLDLNMNRLWYEYEQIFFSEQNQEIRVTSGYLYPRVYGESVMLIFSTEALLVRDK